MNRFLRNPETMKQLMHYIISEWRKIVLVSRWAGKKYTAQYEKNVMKWRQIWVSIL